MTAPLTISVLEKNGIHIVDHTPDHLVLSMPVLRKQLLANYLQQNGETLLPTADGDSDGTIRIALQEDCAPLMKALELILSPQLICLDVDGCLIDVSQSFDAVVKACVASYHNQSVEQKEILELRAAGGYNDDIVLSRELLRRRGVDVSLEELTGVFRDFYFGTEDREGLYKTESPLIDAALLERLGKEFNIALVTGRNRQELELAFPILGLDPNTFSMTIDDVAEGKPHPEGILTAAAHFNAKRVWMFGDNKDDVLAGLNAEAVAIGVSSENRPALENAGAALVLDSINQLEELI